MDLRAYLWHSRGMGHCVEVFRNILYSSCYNSWIIKLMSLLIRSLTQSIFPSCCVVLLKLVIINSILWMPDSILWFIDAPHFGATIVWCLVPMQVFVGIWDFVLPYLWLIYFGAPLSVCTNDVGFWVTFTLGFSLKELTNIWCLLMSCVL